MSNHPLTQLKSTHSLLGELLRVYLDLMFIFFSLGREGLKSSLILILNTQDL